MRKVVIADSSPIIALGNHGYLHLLKELYGEIYIPKAVYDEIVNQKHNELISIINEADWIRVMVVLNKNRITNFPEHLHSGEREAIILYENLNADLIILDDNKARMFAEKIGQTATGVLGILIRAKNEGLIENAGLIVEELVADGFYLSQELIDKFSKI